MTELAREPWRFVLYDVDGRTVLCVVVGGVALDEVAVELTPDERLAFDVAGVDAILPLVKAIETSPRRFADRTVPVPR